VLCGLAIALLLALRLPSLAHPAGADQSLYLYVGQEVTAGGAPYADAWDQKPPGVHVLYGLLWRIWPHESIVAAADLAAATGVSIVLVLIGRRIAMPGAGMIAGALFALLSNPSLSRLSGVYVRGQCETFISLYVALALLLTLSPMRHWWPRAAAGVLIGLAVWTKYNAITYALPVWLCMRLLPTRGDLRAFIGALVLVGVAGLGFIAAHHALLDWRLATFTYNLDYAGEPYGGVTGVLSYAAWLPFRQARYDMLWFLGGAGLVAALLGPQTRDGGRLALAWSAAAVASIVLNGGRDLPQYFVQAAPALAWAAAAGLAAAWTSGRAIVRAGAIAIVLVGLWRVGIDAPVAGGLRLAGLGGLADNLRFDLEYLRGRIDRSTYLARFGGQRAQDKFVASDVEALATHVRETTTPRDKILVFGFSPGVYVKGERRSASRFFWSRPVVIGFEAHRPRYGIGGLLQELNTERPAVIALQKRDWGPGEPNSEAFFLDAPALAGWLHRQYRLEADGRLYSVWRRLE
jgi:hypothetical protein